MAFCYCGFAVVGLEPGGKWLGGRISPWSGLGVRPSRTAAREALAAGVDEWTRRGISPNWELWLCFAPSLARGTGSCGQRRGDFKRRPSRLIQGAASVPCRVSPVANISFPANTRVKCQVLSSACWGMTRQGRMSENRMLDGWPGLGSLWQIRSCLQRLTRIWNPECDPPVQPQIRDACNSCFCTMRDNVCPYMNRTASTLKVTPIVSLWSARQP